MKKAVKHDDRLDCLAQGVKYYTDALVISAYEKMKEIRQEEWQDQEQMWANDPNKLSLKMAFGMNLRQRNESRKREEKKVVHHWV